MFEKLRTMEFKTIAKFIGLWLVWLLFLFLVFGLVSFLFSTFQSTFLDTSRYSNDWYQMAGSPGMYTEEKMAYDAAWAPIPSDAYDIKSYSVNIDSSDIETECKEIFSGLNKEYIKKDSINQSKHYCSFNVKVLKWKEDDFIAFLQTFTVKDLSTNISNIVKSYTNLSDKIDETSKNLSGIEMQIEQTKINYDELRNSLKNKAVNAESIDALNKLILNKSELISKFSKEREELKDRLTAYQQQKADYDEQIQYINFAIFVSEKIIFDRENIKEWWHNDYKQLVMTLNDTIRNLSVNLVSFLLKTINIVVYVVLSTFLVLIWGKWLYKMGRRIIYGKEVTLRRKWITK